jgi:hypothetical protein
MLQQKPRPTLAPWDSPFRRMRSAPSFVLLGASVLFPRLDSALAKAL